MARSLNKVTLIGYIADEPVVRTTNSGGKVANVTLVTNERVKNLATNTWDEVPEWHRLVFWNRNADAVESFIHKGSRIYAEGRLKTSSYVDKTGVKRYTTEIICENMIMLDSRRDPNGSAMQGGFNNNASSYGGGQDSYDPYQSNGGNAFGGQQNYYSPNANQNLVYGNPPPAPSPFQGSNPTSNPFGPGPQANSFNAAPSASQFGQPSVVSSPFDPPAPPAAPEGAVIPSAPEVAPVVENGGGDDDIPF